MNQTTNPTPKNKKSKRNLIIGIVLAVIFVCVLVVVFSGNLSSTPTPTVIAQAPVEANTEVIPTPTIQAEEPTLPPSPTDTLLPPPTDIPNIGTLGERVEKSGIALTVLSASKTNEISFMKPEDGKTYLVIEVLIENVSRDDETPYNAMYFSVKDESGYEYQTTFASPDPSLTSGKLIKGDKVRGFVAFEVLNTSTTYIITYEPLVILGGYEPIRINIGTVQ